jgi:hypothetical protein
VDRVKYGRATLSVAVACMFLALGAGSSAMQTPRGAGVTRPAFTQPVGGGAADSVTGHLHHIVTIGSAVDPINGDQNPYGLAIAPKTSGKITAGDLVICNFNDGFNIQGLGTTMEVLHPTPGSSPQRLAQDGHLTGCASVALSPNDNPWNGAFTANIDTIFDSNGNLLASLSGPPFAQPWGQAFSPTKGPFGLAAFYESNANNGDIIRIAITKNGFKFEVIARGFTVNHGVPGTVLAPAGLTYDASVDTLYIVDSNANRLVAFRDVSLIPAHGIVVNGNSFGGVAGPAARVVFRGAPLAAPISSALLFNGNVVVGNTTNNVLVEINPTRGQVVHTVNLDHGAAGALFGIAATGTSVATTQIFFNDDNVNAVKVLQP